VVDLDRGFEGVVGEFRHGRKEAPVTGLLSQVRVGVSQGRYVIRPYLSNSDDVAGADPHGLRPASRRRS